MMIPIQNKCLIENQSSFFYCLLHILILLFCADSLAQNLMYPFEHYNDQNGLTAPVRKIIQDDFGFLWLATSDGLYRFDGKNFKVFRNKLGDTSSIPNNIVNDICLHPNGNIWIASNGGLCYFSYEDNLFHNIRIPENIEKADRYRVHSVAIDHYRQVWFSTKTAAHSLDHKNELFNSIRLPFLISYSITQLYFDSYNHLFVGTNIGNLIRLDLCTNEMHITQIQSRESIQLKLPTTIKEIYSVGKDTLIITSWYGGLHKIIYSDSDVMVRSVVNNLEKDLQKNVVTGIAKLKPDLWWVVTQGSGIALFDPVKEKYFGQIKYNINNPSGLSNDYINYIFLDKAGIVWIGTNDGLNKYDPLSHQFFSISIPSQENENSIYRKPSCILEDKTEGAGQYLWISISGIGLFHYNRQTHFFYYVPLKTSDKFLIKEQRVYDMIYNRQGKLILCLNSGIYIFNELKREIEPLKFTDKFNLENARSIYQDKSGNYWFTLSSKGICSYKPKSNKWIHYMNEPDNPNSLVDNTVFCLMEDHEGYIWVGTQNRGLSRLDTRNGSFLNFEHHKLKSHSLPDNNVYGLYEDPEHFLWIATENGLARMNPARNEIKIFTTSEGLSNNDIFSITPDANGKLWLGTNNGLSVLNYKDGIILNYSKMDGLASNRLDGATLCCADGDLYFGTNGMISECKPSMILKNEIPPNVIITTVKVHGQEIALNRTGKNLNGIQLNYRQNNFSPEFVALNFTSSAKNKYAYYLEGYDKHWNYCGSQSTTTYTNLPGGNYTFKVKATNNDGIWSTNSDQIAITVHPPFWHTWWFYLVVGFAVFILIYSYFRIKIRQILHLQQLRLDIARDLHDDVGSTLSGINMTSSMAIKSSKNQNELFKNLEVASRRAMEMMNDIVWSIKPENDKPEMMVSRMRQYASEILEPAGIEFAFNIIEKAYHPVIPLSMRKDLFMIFKEALNNLAKYSKASKANISLTLDKTELKLIIEDDGIGFDVNQVQKGNGLKNMEERAKSIRANFKIASKPENGTRVELHVKI